MRKNIFLPICASLLLMVSCSKDNNSFDGPALNDIYGDFFIIDSLNVSNAAVDFSIGQTITCTAEFSKNVNWKLEITGAESGAKYIVEGFSRLLDATNATWTGSTTTLPMFRVENCNVLLTINDEVDSLTSSVDVLGTKTINGFVLDDFEGVLNPGWTTFIQSGADMSFIITDEEIAAQGNKYYNMAGAVDWDWLIGLIDIPASAYGTTTFPLNSNPNNVFFNVMLAKYPGITNSIVLFQFKEDDNGDGIYTVGSEDLFSLEVKLTGDDGWQLISSKYSDLPTLIDGVPADPIGNGIYEPEKLQMISVLMLANPVTGFAKAWMDLLLFTENEPFKP